MKHFLFGILLLAGFGLYGQNFISRWSLHAGLGHYPASIINPLVGPLRPGVHAGAAIRWNSHYRHQFVQHFDVGYFFHKYVQGATQFFTEIAYQFTTKKGLSVKPLTLGGGYVLSFVDQTSLKWNNSLNQYEEVNIPVRHNWMILLGSSISWKPALAIFERPVALTLDYRIQIQGTFIQETAPVIAYAPLRLGIAFPVIKSESFNPPPDIRNDDF